MAEEKNFIRVSPGYEADDVAKSINKSLLKSGRGGTATVESSGGILLSAPTLESAVYVLTNVKGIDELAPYKASRLQRSSFGAPKVAG